MTALHSVPSRAVPVRRASRKPLFPRTAGAGRRLRPDSHKLSIVIPALNEEESIGTTIQRCLDAREHIRRDGHVKDVEVIVVSDGSTDRTAAIAHEYAARHSTVKVIVFEKNRGYGAAIKEGFRQATGDILSFLDADGTCDPTCFGEMCRVLQSEHVSMVLGSRMGSGNQMPRLRRLGNRIYAFLLGFLSGEAVSDTASGMRVLRRDALPHLDSLPDGLHFTPAMSARAIMSDLRIVEVPIPYAERVGESKLHVLRDGWRFLLAIADALLLYRPGRLFGLVAGLCLAGGMFWGMYPVEFYARNHRLEEWMIYRLLMSGFLVTCSFVLVSAGGLVEQMLSLVYRRPREAFWVRVSSTVLSRRHLYGFGAFAFASALLVVRPGLIEYVRTAHVSMHWSRAIVGVGLLQLALLAMIHSVMQRVIGLWKGQLTSGDK
jgi:glycosyltransferase involved in cell wall biosynthesis